MMKLLGYGREESLAALERLLYENGLEPELALRVKASDRVRLEQACAGGTSRMGVEGRILWWDSGSCQDWVGLRSNDGKS